MASMNVKKAEKKGDYSDHMRVVLLGKTGNGKSATANTLIGEKTFNTGSNSDSITESCEAVSFELMDRKILLVDTPGISDTHREESVILNELKNVMEFTYPGPHAFIILLTIGRFTQEEKHCVDILSEFFGKQICNHAMLIFTRVDDLEHDGKTLKEYVDKSKINSFRDMIFLCKSNYFGVSNRWLKDDQKTIDFKKKFLDTVDLIVKTNNNDLYSSIQFETSTKHFEAEKKRIEREALDAKDMQNKMNELIETQKRQMEEMQRKMNEMSQRGGGGGCGGGGCLVQ